MDKKENDELGGPIWTSQLNDLVGGFIVTTFSQPLSQHGHGAERGYVIADCMTENDARMIAHCLNVMAYVPKITEDLIPKFRWVSTGYLRGSLRANPYKETEDK